MALKLISGISVLLHCDIGHTRDFRVDYRQDPGKPTGNREAWEGRGVGKRGGATPLRSSADWSLPQNFTRGTASINFSKMDVFDTFQRGGFEPELCSGQP